MMEAKYPLSPGFHKDAISTSQEAAESMEVMAGTVRSKVAEVYRSGRYTADEVAGILGLSILTVRPRVSELVAQGKLRDTGRRRRNASHKWAAVLEVIV